MSGSWIVQRKTKWKRKQWEGKDGLFLLKVIRLRLLETDVNSTEWCNGQQDL